MRPTAVNTAPALWTPTVIATVLASLGTYIATWGRYDQITDNLRSAFDFEGDQFDFIVVGAGSAGGVVASRLTEGVGHRVLLLEAGGGINPLQTIPAMALLLLNYPSIDWKHKTESHWSQGKGLGGTSNLNFLIQSRGNPKDFEQWAKLTGDDGWSYEGVLPFFKKSEDWQTGDRWSSDVHGFGGNLRITVPEYKGMGGVFIKAAIEMGYPRADLNGYYKEGFDYIYYPVRRGARHGVYGAYLAEPHQKLTIRKHAFVKKILINGNKEAYGVEYDHHGSKKVAYASKEVIVSAGINSPKILMLSGVGPKAQLNMHGIEVHSDRPVGKNLQDHISTYLGPFFVNESVSFNIQRDVNVLTVGQFLTTGSGVLTTSGTQAMGFFTSDKAIARGEIDFPDIQIIFAGVSMEKRFGQELARGFGLRSDIMEQYLKHAENRESFLQIVSLGRPQARGEIALKSDNPYDPALIDPRYLDNENDIQVLIEAIKKAIDLVEKSNTFKSLEGKFTDEVFPGCENMVFKSDEYWECYARFKHLGNPENFLKKVNFRKVSLTLHHIVGACSMGKNYSPDAVVDPQLRVIGIKRLRVIDASVMPVVPVGNTNAPTIMIGEKGADMILQDWPFPEPPTAAPEASTQPPPSSSTSTDKTVSTTSEDDEEEPDEEDYEEETLRIYNNLTKTIGVPVKPFTNRKPKL